jgi:DNA-binding XRE family transcriptional regulator
MAKGRSLAEIGERLRITRQVLGLSQAAFSKAANISKSSYIQFEKGCTRPSIDAANALCDAHRLTLDWIYRGDNSSLPAKISEEINKMRAAREGLQIFNAPP